MTQPLFVDNLPTDSLGYNIKAYEKDGFYLPWHMHDSYELTLIQRGSGQRLVGNHIEAFSSGDMVLLGPNLPHAWKNHSKEGQSPVRALTLKIFSDHPLLQLAQLPNMQPVMRMLESAGRGLQVTGRLRDTIAMRLRDLLGLTEYKQPAAILDILTRLSESPDTRELLPGKSPHYTARESGGTTRVIDYIFEHHGEALNSNILAKIAGIHPSSLGRMFRRNTGFPPTEFINQVRINYACQLLQETGLPILEISLRCGYDNLSWFNRVFRKYRSCTPREYRERLVQKA